MIGMLAPRRPGVFFVLPLVRFAVRRLGKLDVGAAAHTAAGVVSSRVCVQRHFKVA